jgi:all-trans-retinol dehydrogenase (NAD+)
MFVFIAGGIGKCMVKKIMALDAVVVCVDVDRDALTELEKELKTQFPHKFASSTKNAHFYCTDITSIQQIKVLGNSVRNQIGEVSVLVNNAGIVNHGKYLLELSDEEIRKIFDVNILSYFWMSREFLPSMLKKNRGHILNMSSVCGYAGNAGLIDYCSTKFAVQGFSHSLRVELKSMNPGNQIKVSVISPLLVNTNLIQGARLLHMKWLNLFIEPDYVAEEITNGILFKKEVIPVPRIETRLIHFLTK